MIFMQAIQIFTVIVAMYNIYVATMSLNWIKNISEDDKILDKRAVEMFKVHAPMVFRISIVLSVTYISIGILITNGAMTTVPSAPVDYVIRAFNLLTFLTLVRCAQGVLFLEKCHKKRIIIPYFNFRISLPIYQNQNKEFF